MPSIQVRDVPEDIYNQLLRAAKKERRSIAQQALKMIEEALLKQEDDRLKRRKVLLDKIMNRTAAHEGLPSPTKVIREDRDA